MPAPRELVRFDNVAIERDGTPILRNLDLTLCAGRILWLKGPNGSGKSSILKAAAKIIKPAVGFCQANAPAAWLGHRNALKPYLTALENIARRADGKSLIQSVPPRLSQVAEGLGITALLDMKTGRLSAGQQRRVALCALAVDDKPIWLLDEPENALDAAGRTALEALLEEHVLRGGAVLAASHHDYSEMLVPYSERINLAGRTRA